MLAVIDESGDPGFALSSTPYFVVAMVLFDSFTDAQTAAKAVATTKQTLGVRRELKFNSSNDKVRTQFLQAMGAYSFRIHAVIVDKQSIRNQELRRHPQQFAFYTIRHLISDVTDILASGTVFKIDRCGDRAVRDALGTYLRQRLPQGLMKSVKFVDSRNDQLIQLADMVAGAMARPYNAANSKTPNLWREMLKPQIDNEIILKEI